MRFYSIRITDRDGRVMVPNYNGKPGFTAVDPSLNLASYTSLNVGASVLSVGGTNYAAQRIELDIPLAAMDAPLANSFVRIHGVGLQEIAQSANLNGMQVEIFGGMARGLPLANPAQAGKIASGQIFQAFGNWVGVTQTLEFFIGVGGSSPSSSETTGNPGDVLATVTNNTPANITFQWKAGQPLMQPLTNTLQVAFPTYNVVGAVSENLVWTGAASTGAWNTLQQFAQWLRQKTVSMLSGYAPNPVPGSTTYPGVSLSIFDGQIVVTDGTTQTTPKQIQFVDLVGQPTYSQPYTVQCACPMRADIHYGDYVSFAQTVLGITEQGSASQFFNPVQGNNGYANAKSASIFSGVFQVVAIRHVGDSRSPDGLAWVTTFDLQASYTPTTVVQSLPYVYQSTSKNKYGFSL